MFHIQATSAFDLEIISRIEAMAYKPIPQASFKDEPRGFLPGTYGDYSRTQSLNICTDGGKEHPNLQPGQFRLRKLKITIF